MSKAVFGGTVYAAPRHLRPDRQNRLRAFARVPGLVTDGTFFPDGRHVLLRTYGTASVYTFPGFELVGTVTLPSQPQGEGISVSSTGRVLVSSEGVHADGPAGPPADAADVVPRAPADRLRAEAVDVRPTAKHSERSHPPRRQGLGRHRARRWRSIAGLVVARRQIRSTTWSTQAVSASTSDGSTAGNIATRSWLRPSLR